MNVSFPLGFTSIPSTIISTETEEGPQHILSHQVPKHVDIEECFRLYMVRKYQIMYCLNLDAWCTQMIIFNFVVLL